MMQSVIKHNIKSYVFVGSSEQTINIQHFICYRLMWARMCALFPHTATGVQHSTKDFFLSLQRTHTLTHIQISDTCSALKSSPRVCPQCVHATVLFRKFYLNFIVELINCRVLFMISRAQMGTNARPVVIIHSSLRIRIESILFMATYINPTVAVVP